MKKFIIVKDGEIIYKTDNYYNLIRKKEKEDGTLYEKM